MSYAYNGSQMRTFWRYIAERYMVHRRKEIELLPPPWTDCGLLRRFRFTQTFRELDRGTQFVTNYIFPAHEEAGGDLWSDLIFNKTETYEHHGYIKATDYNREDFTTMLQEYAKNVSTIYTSAFVVSGYSMEQFDGMPKTERIGYILEWLAQAMLENTYGLTAAVTTDSTMERTYDALRKVQGLGPFLAYQIAVDLSYHKCTPFGEDDFAVLGPGALNGINHLFPAQGKDKTKNKNSKKTCDKMFKWLHDNQRVLMQYASVDWKETFSTRPHPYLTQMALENALCEFSKYWRALQGGQRPKVTYAPNEAAHIMKGSRPEWYSGAIDIYEKPQNCRNINKINNGTRLRDL